MKNIPTPKPIVDDLTPIMRASKRTRKVNKPATKWSYPIRYLSMQNVIYNLDKEGKGAEKEKRERAVKMNPAMYEKAKFQQQEFLASAFTEDATCRHIKERGECTSEGGYCYVMEYDYYDPEVQKFNRHHKKAAARDPDKKVGERASRERWFPTVWAWFARPDKVFFSPKHSVEHKTRWLRCIDPYDESDSSDVDSVATYYSDR